MNRIDSKFRKLRKTGKRAFIAFITAGYPDLNKTVQLVRELDRRGVDIVELGVPFSDPLADGPIIQEASGYALKRNASLEAILRAVKEIRKHSDVAICLMSYYNPIFSYGDEKFVKAAVSAGVDGVIIPDLPPEEAKSFRKFSSLSGLLNIFFLSPTSSISRIKMVSQASKGFIYYVSLTGVTGLRKSLAGDLSDNIKKIKRYCRKPVCVGFGVSCASQVKEVAGIADGVIVGSAIVKVIRDNINKPGLVKTVGDFTENLNNATL